MRSAWLLTTACDDGAFLLAVCAMKIILKGGKNMMVDVHYVQPFVSMTNLRDIPFF